MKTKKLYIKLEYICPVEIIEVDYFNHTFSRRLTFTECDDNEHYLILEYGFIRGRIGKKQYFDYSYRKDVAANIYSYRLLSNPKLNFTGYVIPRFLDGKQIDDEYVVYSLSKILEIDKKHLTYDYDDLDILSDCFEQFYGTENFEIDSFFCLWYYLLKTISTKLPNYIFRTTIIYHPEEEVITDRINYCRSFFGEIYLEDTSNNIKIYNLDRFIELYETTKQTIKDLAKSFLENVKQGYYTRLNDDKFLPF